MEFSLLWYCNKCERASNRLIRFKNDEVVTGKKIQDRKNKARYTCYRCNIVYSLKKLNKRPQVFEVQDGKQVGQINLEELRY